MDLSSGAVPARHDLLLIEPAGWAGVTATRAPLPTLSDAARVRVDGWAEAGWPVIARRPAPGDRPGAVPVGLPLPPALGKARVALAIPPGVARRRRDGVTLADARSAIPAAWRATADAVLSLGAGLGLAPRVYGALLWQALTGLPYLHAGSDLDLLWAVGDAALLPPLLDGLARIDAGAPVRLDGEVLLACGGVSWRELAAARRTGAPVLVRSLERARFAASGDLVAGAA